MIQVDGSLLVSGANTLKWYASIRVKSVLNLRDFKGYVEFEELVKEAFIKAIGDKPREVWEKELEMEKTNLRSGLYNVLYSDGTWGRIRLDHPLIKKAMKEVIEERKKREEALKKRAEEWRRKEREALERAKKEGRGCH